MTGKNTDKNTNSEEENSLSREEKENKLVKERKKKLKEIREMGVEPYPHDFSKEDRAVEITEEYKDLDEGEKTDDSVVTAGRVMRLRNMGKASFFDIKDSSGEVQLYIREDEIGEEVYELFNKIDIGDFIGAEGTIFKTHKGEVTVNVQEFTLLSKSLRPLPEKYHGLMDKELRYRKRYLDLLTNSDVREVFEKRSKVIKAMKNFLESEGFLEVETPALQPVYGGANATPFITRHETHDMDLYLRISDELYLKKLLVGGFEKVYELCKDFRNEGIDSTHNPEFTQLEWYEAYADYERGMELFENMISQVAEEVLGTTDIIYQGEEVDLSPPWIRLDMRDAIKDYAKFDVRGKTKEEIEEFLGEKMIEYDEGLSRGMLIQTLFEETCEKYLIQPTFIINHPVETTPLCKNLREGSEEDRENFIERFEPYIAGLEVGNAYSELNNPLLQREHFEKQKKRKEEGEEETHPMDENFVEALEYGMPPTSGVGIGVDRIIMLLTNSSSIRDVILFPLMKPK